MTGRRMDSVDALRGLAATGVLIFHIRVIAPGGPLETSEWLSNLTNYLFEAGVPLFFAISGFLLAMLMPSYERHRHPTLSFYVKRFFRIAPMFYAMIFLWFASAEAVPPFEPLIANVTFVFNLVPSMAFGIIFAGWTISVEMLFYFLFPLLNSKVPGAILKLAALLASLVLGAAVDGSILRSSLAPQYTLVVLTHSLPIFIMGMLVFDLARDLKAHPRSSDLSILFLTTSAFVFEIVLTHSTVLAPERYWQGAACGLLLLSFSIRPYSLVNPVTAFVGRISYSIYLLHGYVITHMGHVFLAPYNWGLPRSVAFVVDVAVALAVILPASWVTYRLIEVPGIRLGALTVQWLDRPARGIRLISRENL